MPYSRSLSPLVRALLLAAALQALVAATYGLLGDRLSLHDVWPAMLLVSVVELPGGLLTDLIAPASWPDRAVIALILLISYVAWTAILYALQARPEDRSRPAG